MTEKARALRVAHHARAPHANSVQDAVSSALAGGACLNERDNADRTPLIVAAKHGHEAVCHILVNAGADASATDRRGLSALHHACIEGHATIAALLLDAAKRMPNATITSDGKIAAPPLHLAVEHGATACVKLLLDARCDAAARDAQKATALHIAARNGCKGAIDALVSAAPDLLSAKVCTTSCIVDYVCSDETAT